MTDQEIRQYLSDYEAGLLAFAPMSRDVICPLLKELLAYRSFKMFPCWRVWAPDHSEYGWRLVATFPTCEAALQYRQLYQISDALVLEGHEEPALTAR